jgi:hypothetical protein
MRKPFHYFVIIAVTLVLGLQTSNSFAKEFRAFTSKKITGSWKFQDPNNGPQKLTFHKNGNYELDFDGDGKKDIWGLYKIAQDWLILKDIGGDFVFDCSQQGAYTFRIENDVLTLMTMGDQCPSRSQAMSMPWLRVIEHKRVIEPPIMMKI